MDFCVQFMGVVTNYMWKHREREHMMVLNLRTFKRKEDGECSGSLIQGTTENMSGV